MMVLGSRPSVSHYWSSPEPPIFVRISVSGTAHVADLDSVTGCRIDGPQQRGVR
jgi:hypothetical protein